MSTFKPELLAPAGNIEKLKIAFHHGADACYVGGTVFGLRKFADNFSDDQLTQAVDYANTLGKKVYVVLNGYAHNSDLDDLAPHLETLQKIQPHGFIISDMGVMQLAKKMTSIDLHTSTQASVTNLYGCKLWKNAGAKRVILAREVSIDDCKAIKDHLDIELEVFVHGAMCASYSGKCVISNYTAGRDSNRGGCVQSCRHTYDIIPKDTPNLSVENAINSHIMNAKDLMAVSLIPQLVDSGIDSLKIEGRMKSNLYVANAVSVYRAAIDEYCDTKSTAVTTYESELKKVSNREFSTGGLAHMPTDESINYDYKDYSKGVDLIGTIKAVKDHICIAQIKVPFTAGDLLELVSQKGNRHPLILNDIQTISGAPLTAARQDTLIQFKTDIPILPFDVIRKPIAS
jgi:putative protease